MSKSKKNSVSTSENISKQEQSQDSILGIFTRYFWSLIGNIILATLAGKIYQTRSLFSVFDLLFWGTVLLVILVRFIDIKYLKGITAFGLPATMNHWRKYATYYLLISAGLWALCHILSLPNR